MRTSWGVAAIALLFALYRERLGTGLCLLVCALLWVSPGWQRLCNQTLSDVPGATFMLGCLLVDRALLRRPTWAGHAGLGLLIAAAAYVRTINILVVPALLLAINLTW